jgi:Transposase, Mutator family
MNEDNGLKATGPGLSRLMNPGFGIISARWFVGRLRRPSTPCWTRKRIGFAVRGRYESNQGRQDTRAGSYGRPLHTVAGEVDLKVPKLRRQTFERHR